MSLNLKKDYLEILKNAKPIKIPQTKIKPPPGTLGAAKVIPPKTIPPLNTDIQFNILPKYNIRKHAKLAALDSTILPENFSWGIPTNDDSEIIRNKKQLITQPPNQMLCGSCWAISVAGVVSDNFIVSGVTEWNPNLSTTYSLACYPQNMCQGGNPAVLLQDIHSEGITSNHCVDYSWCSTNEACNGSGTKHFEAEQDISTLVPQCGCIVNREHLLYKLEKYPEVITVDDYDSLDTYTNIVKKQIYYRGPVIGGYIVFRNFLDGRFNFINGGVYFENGVYENSQISFEQNQSSADNFAGCHAIAIVGWGIEKDIIIDNNGTRADVPYWHCRNSWGSGWGDKGYFKMAMYPYNKISQFDKFVELNTSGNQAVQNCGIIICNVSSPPETQNIENIQRNFNLEQNEEFYNDEKKTITNVVTKSKSNSYISKILILIIIIALIVVFMK